MEVTFRTRKLERQYSVSDRAIREYGAQAGRKYISRINVIKQAKDLEELMNLPVLGCHPLKGDRAGQHAIKLTGFYRLIFTLKGEALEIVNIEEVSKHYGD